MVKSEIQGKNRFFRHKLPQSGWGSPNSRIRKILIADNQKMFREGLRALLTKQEGIVVVGEAEDGWEAIKFAHHLSPDIVTIDITMPGLNGIEATGQIIKASPVIKVIALSKFSNRDNVQGMLKAGACGYVLKQCAVEELVEAINKVLDDQIYLCSKITSVVVNDFRNHISSPDWHSTSNMLTSREREITQLIAEEKNTKEIAAILNVSIKTVETHRQHIMQKLNINNVAGLTKYAIRESLTSLDF